MHSTALFAFALIVQLEEQVFCNHRVGGSSPLESLFKSDREVSFMATRLMGSGNSSRHSGYREFFVDDESDIATLPSTPAEIAWGAVALVIATGNVYILNSKYAWVML